MNPQEVAQAFAQNDLDKMMHAVRLVAARAETPLMVQSPAQYAATIFHDLGRKTREEFWVTTLNNANEIIHTHRLYTGTIYTAVLRISEVLRLVINDDATSFYVAHNHPGGQRGIVASPHDIDTTKKIDAAGRLIGCPMVDHVIVAPGQWLSIRSTGALGGNNVRTNEVQRPSGLPGANNRGRQRGQRGAR